MLISGKDSIIAHQAFLQARKKTVILFILIKAYASL